MRETTINPTVALRRQVPDIGELVRLAYSLPSESKINRRLPQRNSGFCPAIEDVGYIIGGCLRIFQSICIPRDEDPLDILFPYSWYLKPGMVLTTLKGKEITLISAIANDRSENTYHNGMFQFQCGQAFRVSQALDDGDGFLLPEEALLQFSQLEPVEDSNSRAPHEPTDPSRCSIAYLIESAEPMENTGKPRGMKVGETVVVSSKLEVEQTIHRMKGRMSFYLYAWSNVQLDGLSRYFREFGRTCDSLIGASGVERFYFESMAIQQTVKRNADMEGQQLRLVFRPLRYCVLTQEFERRFVGVLDKIILALSVSTKEPSEV